MEMFLLLILLFMFLLVFSALLSCLSMVFIFSDLISVDLDLCIVIALLLIKYIQEHGRKKRYYGGPYRIMISCTPSVLNYKLFLFF